MKTYIWFALIALQASTTFLYNPDKFLEAPDNNIDPIDVEQGGIKLPESCQAENSCVSSTPNPLKPT
ncbi:MAG: hypothetical protein Q8N30_14285 [Methylococcales bacterium]|jgi:hypothetical protein|nr:hypothetical protein [Methylococcales bacterium]